MLNPSARAFLIGASLLVATGTADAAPPARFDQRVEQLRRAYGVPGVAIAIVEDGTTTLARGWGVRDITTNQPVDADTIFFTGSTGKAFTTAALATLVDDGKLKWDDKVIDHMPDFRMWDPWVTREMTIRDLLVHRSGLGLGQGDLLFVPNSDLSRKETTRRIRYLKPATSFRSGYAYDNILYMAAGELIEEVSGQTWEQYMRDHVLAPLGMNHSTVSYGEYSFNPDHARAHIRTGGPILGMGAQTPLDQNAAISANASPAGGLAISANDMTRWLLVQLGHGKIPGTDKRLFSEEQSAEMWTPEVIEPVTKLSPELSPIVPNFHDYALGWEEQDYRGAKLIWHSGGVYGSLAFVALLPDKNVGKQLTDAAKIVQSASVKPAAVGPSLPLERYAGDYADPWYGTINVRQAKGGLNIAFPHSTGMSGPLTHYQYDTFKTNPLLKWIEPAYVTFSIDADGKIDRVTMKAVSPVADFSSDYQDLLFTPVAAK